MAKLAMRMRHVTWPSSRGHPKPHIWNQCPQFACSLHNCYGLQGRLRGVYMGAPPSGFRSKIFCPVKSGPKIAVFENYGV